MKLQIKMTRSNGEREKRKKKGVLLLHCCDPVHPRGFAASVSKGQQVAGDVRCQPGGGSRGSVRSWSGEVR